jgi:hypothetical protein
MPKMTRPMPNWRNAYKGIPPRPWLHLQLLGENGLIRELQLLADTGNPYPLIISSKNMASFQQGFSPDIETNFGPMKGGWIRVAIPGLGFRGLVLSYASDAVVVSAKRSHSHFEGLIGLPLLRKGEYGGNARWFWLRSPAKTSH